MLRAVSRRRAILFAPSPNQKQVAGVGRGASSERAREVGLSQIGVAVAVFE